WKLLEACEGAGPGSWVDKASDGIWCWRGWIWVRAGVWLKRMGVLRTKARADELRRTRGWRPGVRLKRKAGGGADQVRWRPCELLGGAMQKLRWRRLAGLGDGGRVQRRCGGDAAELRRLGARRPAELYGWCLLDEWRWRLSSWERSGAMHTGGCRACDGVGETDAMLGSGCCVQSRRWCCGAVGSGTWLAKVATARWRSIQHLAEYHSSTFESSVFQSSFNGIFHFICVPEIIGFCSLLKTSGEDDPRHTAEQGRAFQEFNIFVDLLVRHPGGGPSIPGLVGSVVVVELLEIKGPPKGVGDDVLVPELVLLLLLLLEEQTEETQGGEGGERRLIDFIEQLLLLPAKQQTQPNVPWLDVDQWKEAVQQWTTLEWKRSSKTNRKNKGKQKWFHCAGTRSVADIHEEERVKGHLDLDRSDLFIKRHTRKDGKPTNEAAKHVIEKMKSLKSAQPPSNDSTPHQVAARNDTYTQVLGPDRPGRVSGVGTGPTRTSMWGMSPKKL
ncbi:hypothetical protein Taro_047758, partial [Colocasia esculenta]|nr:hypothetical protein [Colocasia esculenta]